MEILETVNSPVERCPGIAEVKGWNPVPAWVSFLIWCSCPLYFSQAAEQIKLLYKLFLKVDATQVEINPFGETPDGKGTP